IDECKTAPGLLIGTPRYMSPEQARGLPIDFRTDLFSVGAVLYEMLTGQPAARGDTVSDIIAAVLVHNPEPLGKVRPSCPASLIVTVNRALEKDRDQRYASAADMMADLKAVQSGVEIGGSASRKNSRRSWAKVRLVTLVLLVAALALALMRIRSQGQVAGSIAVLPLTNESGTDIQFVA